MRTSDNRRLSMRCSKVHGDRAAIDLLPRVRYALRISPVPHAAFSAACGSVLLEAGLLLTPLLMADEGAPQSQGEDSSEQLCASTPSARLTSSVVALNLSDKIVRLVEGDNVLDPRATFIVQSPGSTSSSIGHHHLPHRGADVPAGFRSLKLVCSQAPAIRLGVVADAEVDALPARCPEVAENGARETAGTPGDLKDASEIESRGH